MSKKLPDKFIKNPKNFTSSLYIRGNASNCTFWQDQLYIIKIQPFMLYMPHEVAYMLYISNYIPNNHEITQICGEYNCCNHEHLILKKEDSFSITKEMRDAAHKIFLKSTFSHLNLSKKKQDDWYLDDLNEALGRFLANISIQQPDECWPWLGAMNGNRGVINIKGFTLYADRVAYMIKNQQIISTEDRIELKCRRKTLTKGEINCCNPTHIQLKVDKVTQKQMKGVKIVPTHDQVKEMKQLFENGMQWHHVADRFPFNKIIIYRILVTKELYRNIEP